MQLQILAGSAFLAAALLAEAGPARLMVQPPRGVIKQTDLREPGTRVDQCLSLYLYEWLSAAPEVRLVDEGQAASVLGTLNSPAWVQRGTELYASVNAAVAIDALITWRWAEGRLALDLQRQGGAKRLETAWTDTASIPKALQTVSDFMASELGIKGGGESALIAPRWTPVSLPASDRARDSAVHPSEPGARSGSEDGQLIEDAYLMRRYSAEWVDNSGEKQLDVLRPYLKRLPQDTWTAAAIVRSGTAMSTDSRGVTKPAVYIMLIQQALPCLLGTAQEPVAIEFMEHNKRLHETIEKDLLAMIANVGRDEVETLVDTASPTDELDGAVKSMVDGAGGAIGILGGPKSVDQQAGAIRCLGAMRSKAAVPHFDRIAKSKEVKLRQAVAWSLGRYASPTGDVTLAALAGDADTRTAFLATYGVWRRGMGVLPVPATGETPVPRQKDLLRLATTCLDLDPACDEAVEVLAKAGDATAAPKLTACLSSSRVRQREWAVQGLLRLGALDTTGVAAALGDTDAAVVRAALEGLSGKQLPLPPGERAGVRVSKPESFRLSLRDRLIALANHPDAVIAESARQRLQAIAPSDPRERRTFDLTVEHPYVRRQIVLALTQDPSAEALADLEAATTNADAHIRALALRGLAQRSPERARARLPSLLADAHRLVRLQAAAVASAVATSAERVPIEKALSETPDDAARLYLQDALARSTGKAVPPSRPRVNRVSSERNLSFNCGTPSNGAQTPFDGFYIMNTPAAEQGGETIWQAIRLAQATGKVILPRANKTAKNPAQVFLNPGWRDGFWLGLDQEFGGRWEAMDGLVLGEESMYFSPCNEWANGWRLFCREAGIDPQRVAGSHDKLTETEKQAWWDWEQRVAVEGFNAMVDYIRLRYGKLRPGFQVATFMPDQNGPCAYDRQWDFDIAAGYYYEAPSRTRYATIRRIKTTWPDRPVLWLNQGKVGVGLGLNQTAIQHSTPVPTSPLHSLTDITSADSLCTWLAGGHTGLFSIYLFVHVGWKGEDVGRWVGLEDISPTSPVFAEALEHSFRGLGKKYRLNDEIKAAKPEVGLTETVEDFELDDPAKKADPYAERENREKESFRQGFLLERRLIQDGVNLLSGVPFPPHRHEVLLVGPNDMRAPGFDLANDFDGVALINHLAEMDLGGYRLLGLTGQARAPLRDGTVTNVSAWLREQPGVLYVHGWVSTDKTNAAVTARDLRGRLTVEWPWVGDVTPIVVREKDRGRDVEAVVGYEVRAASAQILKEQDGRAVLVFWQGQGMKGGVLFDAGKFKAAELQPIYNGLVKDKAVGVALTGPIGMEGVATPEFSAMTSCGAAVGPWRLPGVDALSGVGEPELGPRRSGALTAKALQGKFLAATNGVTFLGERPIEAVEGIPGGLKVKGGGLLQAVSDSGTVTVEGENGTLPVVSEKDLLGWMLASERPGVVDIGRTNSTARTLFVRAPGWVTLRPKQ